MNSPFIMSLWAASNFEAHIKSQTEEEEKGEVKENANEKMENV